MAHSFHGASVDAEDDDTIELELSEATMQWLSEAAAVSMGPPPPNTTNPVANDFKAPAGAPNEAAEASASSPNEVPRAGTAPPDETPRAGAGATRLPRMGTFFAAVAVAAALLTAVIYLASAHIRRPDPVAPRAVSASAAAPVSVAPSPPAASTPADATPVRFVNPFDRKEVFEFSPGTSEADARQAVAELLSERARERRSLLVKVPRRAGKTANRVSPATQNGPAPRS